jgi:pilus assembly protein Flp/PilA
MLSLIIVVCIAAITTLGQNANATFSAVGSAIVP